MRALRWILAAALLTALGGPAIAGPTLDEDTAKSLRLTVDAIADHRLVLLGEKHGTRQIPPFVAALVEQLSESGPIVLAMELPRSEQASLQQYLESDGGNTARLALRSTSYWNVQSDQHDGRRSLDMLDLIEQVRLLRKNGKAIELLGFDLAPGTHHDSQSRDQFMAKYLREQFLTQPAARFLVLTGNVHAMLIKPSYAPAQMQTPMGSYLSDLHPYSVNINARSGAFWGCQQVCSPIRILTTGAISGPTDDPGYDLEVVLAEFSVARLLGIGLD
jgi:erythromycin esterase-like protein